MEAYEGRFYDRYFVGVEGDVPFYAEEARRAGGAVLEIGCGTGRILLPAARAGACIAGLDLSADLLERARTKVQREPEEVRGRVELVRGDMRDFSLDRRFALAMIPYRTFQHLLDPADQEQALLCIGEHLQEEGLLVFNVFDPLRELMAEGLRTPLRKDTDFADPETGNQVVVCYARECDAQTQVMEQEIVYEEIDARGRSLGRTYSRLALRWTGRWEMEYLLERCGFVVEALYGDFEGGPYPGFGEQVWVARREGGP